MTGTPGGDDDESTPTPDDVPAGDRISDVDDNSMPADLRDEVREQAAQERATGGEAEAEDD